MNHGYRPIRKPRRRVRTVLRQSLPAGIYRWEIYFDCNGPFSNPEALVEPSREVHALLKRSASGRWKVTRTTWRGQRVIDKIFLERDSDAVLVKLCVSEPIYKVFRNVLPGELGSP